MSAPPIGAEVFGNVNSSKYLSMSRNPPHGFNVNGCEGLITDYEDRLDGWEHDYDEYSSNELDDIIAYCKEYFKAKSRLLTDGLSDATTADTGVYPDRFTGVDEFEAVIERHFAYYSGIHQAFIEILARRREWCERLTTHFHSRRHVSTHGVPDNPLYIDSLEHYHQIIDEYNNMEEADTEAINRAQDGTHTGALRSTNGMSVEEWNNEYLTYTDVNSAVYNGFPNQVVEDVVDSMLEIWEPAWRLSDSGQLEYVPGRNGSSLDDLYTQTQEWCSQRLDLILSRLRFVERQMTHLQLTTYVGNEQITPVCLQPVGSLVGSFVGSLDDNNAAGRILRFFGRRKRRRLDKKPAECGLVCKECKKIKKSKGLGVKGCARYCDGVASFHHDFEP